MFQYFISLTNCNLRNKKKKKKKNKLFSDEIVDEKNSDVSPDEKRRILKDILPYIRFPLMSMEDLIAKVAPTKLLPSDHLLAIYSYVGARDTGKPRFDLHYPTTERKPRKPNAYFGWDPNSTSTSSTWDQSGFNFGGMSRIQRSATVSDNGQTLTSTGTGWITAYGLTEWHPKSGVYDWEILLDQYNT